MRVLQINTVYGRGSIGRIMMGIHKALLEEGHESYVAYGRNLVLNHPEAIRIGTDFDVYAHVLLTRLFDLHGFGSKRATKSFLRKVEEMNPDVIHLHNIHGYYINIELLFDYLKEKQKPVVWTLHDCWAFTGHCAYFDYVGCYKWKSGCYNCPQKKKYPSSYLMDNSKRNFERKKKLFNGIKKMLIVTPSKWLADLVKESFLKEYPVEVIPNGIDTNVFKPTRGDFRSKYNLEEKFIILGVANVWEERKGLRYFLELAGMLREDEVIVLVGLKKNQIKKLPAKIVGIERTNSAKELAEIYTTADVFLNPTLEDNYPTVNLEAQACGTYVITFDSGGAKETILSANSGFVVTDKSAANLRRVIDERRELYNRVKITAPVTDLRDTSMKVVELYRRLIQH